MALRFVPESKSKLRVILLLCKDTIPIVSCWADTIVNRVSQAIQAIQGW
jgi:hypothetical protein